MTRQQKIKKIEDKIKKFHINFYYSIPISAFSPSFILNQVDDLLIKYNSLSSFTKDIKEYNTLIEIGVIIDNIYFYNDIQKLIVESPDKKIEICGNIQNLFYKVEENKYRALEKDDLILQSEKVNKGHLYSSYTEMSKDNVSNFCYNTIQNDIDDANTLFKKHILEDKTETDWRDCIIFILCFIPTMTLLGIGLAFILKYISNLMI